jgi:hypothetical protein
MGARSMQARLQRILGRPVPEKEVRDYIEELASAYPKAEHWRKSQETGDPDATTTTRTMHGRLRRKVTSNPQRFNTPIQGSAADVLKAIAVAVMDEIVYANSHVELCALIHDEVVLLVEEARAEEVGGLLAEVMERIGDAEVNGDNPPALRVPIKADTSEPKKSLGGKEAEKPTGSVVHVKKKPYDVYIGREVRDRKTGRGLFEESVWHNPFKEGRGGTREVGF